MQTIKIKDITIGKGRPKICIPLVSRTEEQLEAELRLVKELPCQLVEWRADFYLETLQGQSLEKKQEEIIRLLANIKMKLDIPIIFAIRTKNQDGREILSKWEYFTLNAAVAEIKLADFIDLELDSEDEKTIKKFITFAYQNQTLVILSEHDFEKTRPTTELLKSLIYMQRLGADMPKLTVIPKLAVMPQNRDDAARLLEAAAAMRDYYAKGPFIVIAMGEIGMETRICAGEFGSAITFAAGKKASAPGQLEAVTLDRMLSQYYSF